MDIDTCNIKDPAIQYTKLPSFTVLEKGEYLTEVNLII